MASSDHHPTSLNALKRTKQLARIVANIELDYHVRFDAACELVRVRQPKHCGTLVAIVWVNVDPPTVEDFDLVADAFAVERELAALPTQSFKSPAMGEASG